MLAVTAVVVAGGVAASCPSLGRVLSTPKPIRWEVWNDRHCGGPCRLSPCSGKEFPCCVKAKPMPVLVPGTSRCDADGNVYACGRPKCKFVRPCASDPGLLACSCAAATQNQIESAIGNPALTAALSLVSPCLKVEVGKPLAQWQACMSYIDLPIDKPRQCDRWAVPAVIHSMGRDDTPGRETQMIAAVNPRFRLHHMGDRTARAYVFKFCGSEAARAYDCFIAPAFRADLARYCILATEGGVYLDGDIVMTAPIHKAVDMCGGASVGYDIPQAPVAELVEPGMPAGTLEGKQMKILAGAAGHPLFRCMVAKIVRHVRARALPPYPLMLTGPQLLHKCYIRVNTSSEIHVTYRDTRGAKWPYTGMVGKEGHLAFETTKPENFAPGDFDTTNTALEANHYHELYLEGKVYTDTCDVKPLRGVAFNIEEM